MKLICVDDERLLMEDTVAMCRTLPGVSEVEGFVSPEEALRWVEQHPVDVALLDIDMPQMNGLALAAAIKERTPDTAVIFLTGYSEYALEAFSLRASGYLVKPVTREALMEDVTYVRSQKYPRETPHIMVQTFGTFEVFRDGRSVKFKTAKCKELLAYLVDRQGGSVKRAELSAVLWEDRLYDRNQQKTLDVYIRALRDTLAEYGIPELLEMERGTLRIVPETFSCDLYRFLAGDAEAVNAYRGEYMSAYSWASITEGNLYGKTRR